MLMQMVLLDVHYSQEKKDQLWSHASLDDFTIITI
jgi:hypothetical protein